MILIFTSSVISNDLINQVVIRTYNQATLVIHLKDKVRELRLCISAFHLIGPADSLPRTFLAPNLTFSRSISHIISFVNKFDKV
jgi:hypothetical protein